MCATAEGRLHAKPSQKSLVAVSQSSLVPATHDSIKDDVEADHAKESEGSSFVRALDFSHSLRVCNAFPSGTALEITRGKDEKLTGDEPMPYKGCRDFKSELKAGDKLEFRLGEQSAGTFSVTVLPESDAVLFLVIHRHDAQSTAVAFESHVFASLANPQVAVIDTYKGVARSSPRIMDGVEGPLKNNGTAGTALAASAPRSEMLRYDSVFALNQGIYEVELDADDGKVEAKTQLVALARQSYVVLRTGVEAKEGTSYPQELIIFPNSNPAPLLHSGANYLGASAMAMFFTLFAAMA